MEKQPYKTEWLAGYIKPDGEFVRNPWQRNMNREDAVMTALEYTAGGNRTLEDFGVTERLRPAVVKRDVYYDESDPEVV